MSKITDEFHAEVGTLKTELARLLKRFDHIAEEVVAKVLGESAVVLGVPAIEAAPVEKAKKAVKSEKAGDGAFASEDN